jgi:hypothetical protein
MRKILILTLLLLGFIGYLWLVPSTHPPVEKAATHEAAMATSAAIVVSNQATVLVERRERKLLRRVSALEEKLLATQAALKTARQANASSKDSGDGTRSDGRTTQQLLTLRLARELETVLPREASPRP